MHTCHTLEESFKIDSKIRIDSIKYLKLLFFEYLLRYFCQEIPVSYQILGGRCGIKSSNFYLGNFSRLNHHFEGNRVRISQNYLYYKH